MRLRSLAASPADREAALALLQTQGETDPDIKAICDNAAVYSDKILQCLAINSEMKQFVIDLHFHIRPSYPTYLL